MVEMTKLREIANVRQGLATADDNYYLRKEAWKVVLWKMMKQCISFNTRRFGTHLK